MTGKQLQDARVRAGMSQLDLAEKWGVSRDTIARWEGGTRRGQDGVFNVPVMTEICAGLLPKLIPAAVETALPSENDTEIPDWPAES